jgi:hypothetical protein
VLAVGSVVQAEHDGAADSGWDDPDKGDGQPDASVVLVLGVLYGLGHCDVPASTQTSWQSLNACKTALHYYKTFMGHMNPIHSFINCTIMTNFKIILLTNLCSQNDYFLQKFLLQIIPSYVLHAAPISASSIWQFK